MQSLRWFPDRESLQFNRHLILTVHIGSQVAEKQNSQSSNYNQTFKHRARYSNTGTMFKTKA